ncbi:hypothetical protein [Dyadobacter sp. 3J3]|uniref:hypothetical protein n=1 Tax=Dyadobacter sp. 3J3 TaxID=2606600 RepID=UPI00135C252D|nr:hypothetical protein [Dyadobacter sp. 3J3]
MNRIALLVQKYFSRAALAGYLLAFIVWVLYNNALSILVSFLFYPSYKLRIEIRGFICRLMDTSEAISFFLWFTLLKLSVLIILFLLLKTSYLKVFHGLLRYLLTIEFTVCVLYFILQIASLVYPFHVSSFFFAVSPLTIPFVIWKMDPWPAFALIGFVSAFLLNRLGLFSKKDIIIRIALTVLSFLIYVILLRLAFGHW